MGNGHSGDSSGRDFNESNQYVDTQIKSQITKYANSLGLQLSPDDINSVLAKVRPDKFTGGLVYDADRSKAIEDSMNFILPTLANLKFNPTTSNDNLAKAGEVFKNTFGRDATSDEAAYFAKELAQGKSGYELQQELQSLPEYQKMQAQKDRDSLAGDLLNQQQQAFARAQPQIISSFMKAGRLGSSGLNSAMARAQADLERERQGFLGQAGYNDVSNIRNQAYNSFQQSNAPWQAMYSPGAQIQNQFGLVGGAMNRQNELSDYYRQSNDYQNYLNQKKSQDNKAAWMGLAGGAIGAGIKGAFAAG